MTDQVQFLNDVAAHVRTLIYPDTVPGRSFQAEFPRSTELISGVESGQTLVGGLPPQPPTFRGRVGKALIELIRRSLFWYTPAIHAFQRAVAAAFREQNEATSAVRSELSRRLSLIEKENQSLREQLHSMRQSLGRWDNLEHRIVSIEEKLFEQEKLVNKNEFTERINDLQLRITSLSERIGTQSSDVIAAELQEMRQELAGSIRNSQAVDRFTLATRAEMILVERRISGLVKQMAPRGDSANIPETEVVHPNLLSDVVYYDFENLFRGSEQEIKDRVKVYVSRFAESGLGTPDMPIVDVGCGRGEWLDILREHRLLAYGVDGNSSMIATCLEKGLAVEEQDGIQHLRSLPNCSVGAVTAFHFIEHLPVGVLLSFIDEVLRVLKPGGVALFETPNPDNVLVGSATFYLDPTHQRPIPGALLEFLMQSRGFGSIEVQPLHPYPPEFLLDQSTCPAARIINERLFGCQDYCLWASKI
jgi:SAM-dependent methyltransferase